MRTRLELAGAVTARGEQWTIVDTVPFDRCAVVTLRGVGDQNFGEITRLIAPFDHIDVPIEHGAMGVGTRTRALRATAAAVANAYRWDDCWTAARARIDLLAWQLEPARAAVRGATRLLLADAVGLGKTIQAGLVLAELRARRMVTRALVLTPAALQHQWAAELSDRFGLGVVVFDHAGILRASAALPPGVNPWCTEELIVSSIDLVKRPDVRTAIDAAPFDLLIVDEAHHLAPDTDRGAVVRSLAERTAWIVLVTATPHSGDERSYTYLRSIGGHTTADCRVFRRTARDAGRDAPRREHLLGVRPIGAERDLVAETLRYARSLWRTRRTAPARLLAAVIARRATSSPHAALLTLTRRRALLAGSSVPDVPQPLLPWEEADRSDADASDDTLRTPGLDNVESELAQLDRLIALADEARSVASKRRLLQRFLRRVAEPVLIFSEYRDTVTHLAKALSAHGPADVLHGGLGAAERRHAVRQFVGGATRLLFATDTAGEGLNLHHRCRLVVNVELPWNPLRLEQRVGRVDRFGQQRRVHAVHLYYRDSFEEHVLASLSRRIMRAESTLAGHVDPDDVVTAILNDELLPVANPQSPRAERNRIDQPVDLGRHRSLVSWSTHDAETVDPLAPVASNETVRGTGCVLLVFAQDFRSGDGRSVARDIIPVQVRIASADAHDTRELAQGLLLAPALRGILHESAAACRAALQETLLETARQWTARLSAIETALTDSRAHRPVQTSLFDRRAADAAIRREADLRVLVRHVRDRVAAAHSLRTVLTAAPRLVAAWPVE